MKYYYDRTEPLRIVTEPTFDGVAVDLDPDIAQIILELRGIYKYLAEAEVNAGAPEDDDQRLTDLLEYEISNLFVKRKTNAKKATSKS